MKTKQISIRQSLILALYPSLLLGILFYSNNPHLVHFDNSVGRFLSLLSLLFFIWIFLLKKFFFLPYLPLGFSSAFCFLILFQQLSYKNILITILSFLFTILIYFSRKYMKIMYIFYFCVLFSQFLQGYSKYKNERNSEKFDLNIKKYNQPLKKSYSVYYLLIDSYPSYETLLTQDKLNHSEFMHWLTSKSFSTNKNAYSNYARTYTSMQATFQMEHNYYKNMNPYTLETPISRFVMAGANPVMGRFYNNGFSVYINSTNKWNGRVDKKINLEVEKQDIEWFIEYYHRTIGNISNFLSYGSKDIPLEVISTKNQKTIQKDLQKDKSSFFYDIKRIKDRNSKFVYLHTHVLLHYKFCYDLNHVRNNYIKKFECGTVDLKESINYIIKNDPNSIIILQADHGPQQRLGYWTKNILGLKKFNFLVSNIQRRFGILFSIRWPENCKYLGKEKYTPINLFPRVFACLNGEKPNYQKMKKDDSYLIGIWSDDKSKKPDEVFKVIENNQILPEYQ